MAYEYISITPKIVPLSEFLTQTFAEGIFREEKLARMAPEMLVALKKAQKALLFSHPTGVITEEVEAEHRAAHQAVCDILVLLHEMK